MERDRVDRKLAAILSADVVGYSRLMADDEDATLRTLRDYREALVLLVEQHRGRVVDAPGDNLLAEFPSALDATTCAVEAQRVITARNSDTPSGRRMQYRIGLHLGDVMLDGERIHGDGVNIAARLEGLAEPGGICVSATVHEQVRHRLDLGYEDLGAQTVKNIPDPIRVYRVRPGGAAAAPAPSARTRRPLALGLVAAGLVAAALLGWRALAPDRTAPAAGNGPIDSVAVLPLDNLSGDPEQEFFTEGMTEALIAELGQLPGLRVISRTSAMHYKGANEPLPKIAAALDVEGIIEASVLRADDRVRLTVQLIDARSDDHLWAESYDRELRNVLGLQREVAEAIAGEIGLRVGESFRAERGPAPLVDPAAHESYLRGQVLSWKMKPATSLKAVELFERAIRIDPGYALGYSGLADAYSCTPTHAWSIPDSELWPSVPQELMARARLNALRAIELDDSLAAAHSSLGLVRMFHDWDWEGAEASFRRALEIEPSSWWARTGYSLLLIFSGRLDEALEQMQRAYDVDPLNTITIVGLADLHAMRGERDQATALWRKAQDLDPDYPPHHQSLITSMCREGEAQDVIPSLERARALAPDDPPAAADLGYCYAVSGRTAEARAILAGLEELSRRTYVSPMHMALIHVGIGDADATFGALEQAYADRSFFLPYIAVDAPYAPLRSDPRYRDLLRRIGLPPDAAPAYASRS
jgi:class 3 adenylate cyclase/TolB-like protein/tetratricopeptide (TPR) repeat protein